MLMRAEECAADCWDRGQQQNALPDFLVMLSIQGKGPQGPGCSSDYSYGEKAAFVGSRCLFHLHDALKLWKKVPSLTVQKLNQN